MRTGIAGFSLLGLFAVLAGCGSGEYEKRLDAYVEQLEKGSSFRGMQPPVSLPDVQVSVRLPAGVEPLDAGGDDRRRQVPGAKLPNLRMTVEGFAKDSQQGKIAYYGYFGAADLSHPASKNLERHVLLAVREVCPDSDPQWNPAKGETPAGAQVEWQKAVGTAQQEFYYVDASGNEDYRTTKGRFEVWIRRDEGFLLIMAWRVPTDFLPQTGLEERIPRVAGTMTVTEEKGGG